MNIDRPFAESPVFETDRLILRRFSLDDAEDDFAMASSSAATARL